MGVVRPFVMDRFNGIDTRPGRYGEDRDTLLSAVNCSAIAGGMLRIRPAMRKVVDLHSESCGLYVRGGTLRAVVPGGHSIQDSQPSNVVYDPIGDGSAYPLGKLSRLVAATTFGTDPIAGASAYVAVLRSDNGQVEHHYLQAPPILTSAAVSTRVGLPFTAGQSLQKLETKLWAPATDGTVPFSSSVNGPTDWTAANDAGFLPVAQHASGRGALQALGHYRGALAVFFPDSVQFWQVDADPSRHRLLQAFDGPGAILQGAVANVLGDVFFLSRGGFRRLSAVAMTGEAIEDDVGSRIRTLTDLIATTTPAVSLWSQTRSQFLCAIGATVFCLTWIPAENLAAWTTWALPTSVDHLVELDGVLYARSGSTLYQFDDAEINDYTGDAVTATGELGPFMLGAPGRLKTLHFMTLRQTDEAAWRLVVDGTPLRDRLLPGAAPKSQRFVLNGEGRQVTLRFNASAARWTLEGFGLEYETQVA